MIGENQGIIRNKAVNCGWIINDYNDVLVSISLQRLSPLLRLFRLSGTVEVRVRLPLKGGRHAN